MKPLTTTIRLLTPLALLGVAHAQSPIPVFSIGWNGPTISLPDSFTGMPITEGDLLIPQPIVPQLGPLPTPGIVESAGFLAPVGLGLANHLPCMGHPAYTPCSVEVDALSHGLDALIQCGGAGGTTHHEWAFSVNRRGIGVAGSPFPPAVWTEAPCQDEDADVYNDLGLPCGPFGGLIPNAGHTAYIDGNGLPNCAGTSLYPGTGLIENVPGVIPGDNLDALDDDVPDPYLPQSTCTYFSLDSAFIDPGTGGPNSGSAAAHGFVGGDVLRSCPSCAPAVYAPAFMLGLDLVGGPDSDDLDGLALRENGVAGYQRSMAPYDWLSGQTDMLFFSVRRGSAVVGVPDSVFGLPIEPGDILFPTGAIGAPPGIWMRAENLGLATSRGITPWNGDDIDALDALQDRPTGVGFCGASTATPPCPCANNGAPNRGCANSVNSLGALLWATGIPSLSADTVHFTASGMPNTATVILVQGTLQTAGVMSLDGVLCIGGTLKRLYVRSSLCGNREFGYGVPGDSTVSVAGGVTGPGTRYYQAQYRDPNVTYCTPALANWSSAYSVVWTP